MPYLIFLLICAIWGASFILMKKAALAFGPIGIGGLRVLGGAMVMGMFWQWRKLPDSAIAPPSAPTVWRPLVPARHRT